ncbi:MAG: hypothetical protein PF508_16740 [Spirochaeta sp.]|jgi:cell division protein FtsL|nr:hypothetical protein [Spirochaeta sp.]
MSTRIRTIILASLIVVTPLLFVANVWQSYRFSQVEGRLERIHRDHLQLLEENKRLIVGIAGLRSPARVRELAEGDLGLEAVPAERIERIRHGREHVEGE